MRNTRLVWALVGLSILSIIAFVGCSKSKDTASGDVIKLTYYSTAAEVNSMFEEMFVKYHEINPGVVIELIPTGVGQGQQEQLQSLYASKNAPTFMNIDPGYVLDYKDKLLAFDEGQPWLKYLAEGAIEVGRFDGKVLGVPFTTQGYGINYNKRVVEKVIPGFDPKLIKTRNDLEAFFKELDAASIPPTMIHGANWSLGAHYLGLVYAVQSPETEGGKVFLEGLRDGTVDIGENPIFQGYMDTFDLLAKYNYNKADPLVGNIITDDQAFAQGKCASFFMGDWAWTIIGTFENKDEDFGFIPVPWSNDPNAYGNSQVAVSMPKLMCIDASQSTGVQQKAALEVLEWMLTTPEGQEYFVGAGFSMPYTNIRPAKYNSMTESISSYINEGKTINLGCLVYMTADGWVKTGDLMLKYLAGDITRDRLAQEINATWRSTIK